MTTAQPTVAEITAKAIVLLCREIGPVNTARFLNQFTTGLGNYTEERAELIGNPTVDELVAEIKQRRDKAPRRLKPRGTPSRSAKRQGGSS